MSSWTTVSHSRRRPPLSVIPGPCCCIFNWEVSRLKRANEEKKKIYFFCFLGAAGASAFTYEAYARQIDARWLSGTAVISKYSWRLRVGGSGVTSRSRLIAGRGNPCMASRRCNARSRVSRSASVSMKRSSSGLLEDEDCSKDNGCAPRIKSESGNNLLTASVKLIIKTLCVTLYKKNPTVIFSSYFFSKKRCTPLKEKKSRQANEEKIKEKKESFGLYYPKLLWVSSVHFSFSQ